MEFFVFTTLLLVILAVYLSTQAKALKAEVEQLRAKETTAKVPTPKASQPTPAKKPGRKPMKPIVAAKTKK